MKGAVDCLNYVKKCFTPEQIQITQELFLERVDASTKKLAAMNGVVDPIDFEKCAIYRCIKNDDCDDPTINKYKTSTIAGATAAAIFVMALLVVIFWIRKRSNNRVI